MHNLRNIFTFIIFFHVRKNYLGITMLFMNFFFFVYCPYFVLIFHFTIFVLKNKLMLFTL